MGPPAAGHGRFGVVSDRASGWPRRVAAWLAIAALTLGLGASASLSHEAPPVPAQSLAAPADLQASARDTVALLSWRPVPGSAGYQVVVSSDPASTARRVLSSADTTLVVADLHPGTRYWVQVSALEPGGRPGPAGRAVSVVTGEAGHRYPAPHLELTDPTTTSLLAAWEAPGEDLAYEVEVAESTSMIDASRHTTRRTSLLIDDLVRDTEYWFRIRALRRGTGEALSPWSPPVSASTAEDAPLIVASYNITCFKCGGSSRPWSSRRDAVAATIREQAPDVMGIQEATPTKGQIQDLVRLVGGPYRTHSTARAAGGANRLLYNSDTVELLTWGARKIPTGKFDQRYVLWGLFRQKATGKRFLFTNTHLEPGPSLNPLRLRQLSGVLAAISANRPAGVPSIVVGDFNSHKWTPGSNAVYDRMLANGYLDPLDNAYHSKTTDRDAAVELRIHTNFNSYNGFRRTPKRQPRADGINIDYIFVSPMRVSEFETVVRVDSSGDFIGTIPSDHNMIRATVWLP